MHDEIIRIYKVPRDKIVVVEPSTNSWVKEVLSLYDTVSGGSKNK